MKKKIASLLSEKRDRASQSELIKTNKLLLEQIETLQKQLEFKRNFVLNPSTINISSMGNSESTAFALLSDVHFEETIEPSTVMGLNQYNTIIARKRLQMYFYRIARMIKKEQQQTTIDTLCLAVLGDLISGYIHDTLMEINELPPANALMEVVSEIAGGIKYLLKNSDVKIDVVCLVGNHGRMQKDLHIAKETGNAIETIAYHFLAKSFQREKRLKFWIPEAYLFYYKTKDFVVGFHHGHFVRYNGGIGGLTIPMNKAIAQWEKMQHADLYCCGHWHQFFDGGNFIVNGSVCGFNAYAVYIKAGFEKPKQTFFLVNHKYNCKTVVTPILFDI